MTDNNSYPPDWDMTPPPDPLDPRLGDVLDSIQPTNAERALVADLVHRYVSRDQSFAATFEHFWCDRYTDRRWHVVFLALWSSSRRWPLGLRVRISQSTAWLRSSRKHASQSHSSATSHDRHHRPAVGPRRRRNRPRGILVFSICPTTFSAPRTRRKPPTSNAANCTSSTRPPCGAPATPTNSPQQGRGPEQC